MSIASVATRGYGTWSTVNKVPTWGYGIGVAVASPAYETARHTLYGTSLERHTLHATSNERHTLSGSTP